MVSKTEVMVIGAGLSGLAVSALLCERGLSVTVVEEADDVGGRLRALSREGYCLDAGLHCFHYAEAGPLGELDQRLSLGLSYLESREAGWLIRGKNRQPFPPGAGADISGEEAERINKWFAELMDSDPAEQGKKSVADLLAEAGLMEDELILGYANALCLPLFGRGAGETSAAMLVAHSRALGRPDLRLSVIEGGPGRLIRALAGRLNEKGGWLALGARAHELELRGRRVSRVATSAEEYSPAAVVYAAPLKPLPALFSGDQAPSSLLAKIRRLRPAAGVALELGLDSKVCDLPGLFAAPEEFALGRFPSNLDPSLAPAGKQISSWLALVPPEDLEEVKTARSRLKKLKKIALAQFPEMADQVRWERIRVLPSLSEAAPLPSLSPDKRPSIRQKQIENLFLCGDGVNAQGLLSGVAVQSALLAAEAVMKFFEKAEPGPGEED